MQIMEDLRMSNEEFEGKLDGKDLPQFTAKDLKGNTFTRKSIIKGKVTFLNFWYLSCAPCIAEVPNLNRLYDLTKKKADVQFFAITWESQDKVKEAIKKYNIRFPILMTSPKDIRKLTFARGYPVNMVLDRKGKIYAFMSGGQMNPGKEFELYWKYKIGKVVAGDTAINIQPDHTKIQFIESTMIRSFDDLANYFKGQPVFIDIWVTWCLPCREEFKASHLVDSFLQTNKIARLYIAINNPLSKENWETVVNEFQPVGYHLLAGPELFNEIKTKIYKKDESINDHKHILIKDGKIVELDGHHPTDTLKLMNRLKEELLNQ
jgi:thiol-disulfide isomerase/thioredoxin